MQKRSDQLTFIIPLIIPLWRLNFLLPTQEQHNASWCRGSTAVWIQPLSAAWAKWRIDLLGHHSGLVCYTSIDNLNMPQALHPEGLSGRKATSLPVPPFLSDFTICLGLKLTKPFGAYFSSPPRTGQLPSLVSSTPLVAAPSPRGSLRSSCFPSCLDSPKFSPVSRLPHSNPLASKSALVFQA